MQRTQTTKNRACTRKTIKDKTKTSIEIKPMWVHAKMYCANLVRVFFVFLPCLSRVHYCVEEQPRAWSHHSGQLSLASPRGR